ncbi:MAG: hypothetical protein IJM90_09175 [Firmicutes bacterium]|nr:hypothetical protein [Bacillota bacterium]
MQTRRVYYYTPGDLEDLDEFREASAKAKAAGITHMVVGQLPRSLWMWDLDRSDPYCNWMMGHTPLFRLACPPQLQKYFPMDFFEAGAKLVEKRMDILRELGMGGAIFSNEPFWLPEQAFLDHPAWRGPRMDHPRRSRNWYYAPSVDNQEVLDMYAWSAREIGRRYGIDIFHIKSNDAGGGLEWSNGTYVGPNGRSDTKNNSMVTRVSRFVQTIAAGLRESCPDAVVNFNTNIGFKLEEVGAGEAWHELQMDRVIINDKDRSGKNTFIVGPSERNPNVKGMTDFVNLTGFLENTQRAEGKTVLFGSGPENLDTILTYLRKLGENPTHGVLDRTRVMHETAKELVGAEGADLLVDAWFNIHEGLQHFGHSGLDVIMYGIVHQRWINRPFVLFPEELKPEEYEYYRPYQFQALGEKQANDLLDMQNIECLRGFSAAFLVSESARKATGSFNKALDKLEDLCDLLTEEAAKPYELLQRCIRVYEHLMRTCVNAAKFQTLVDDIDYDAEPALDCRWPTRNDPRIEQYQNITRDEIDNAYETADLLEGHLSEVLRIAAPGCEDIFTFGPDLVSQIRRKAEIMLAHQLDGNRVFERHNI